MTSKSDEEVRQQCDTMTVEEALDALDGKRTWICGTQHVLGAEVRRLRDELASPDLRPDIFYERGFKAGRNETVEFNQQCNTTCSCTYEAGDSDCLAHPTCPGCGEDIAGTRCAAEVRRLRGEAVLLNDMVKDADERALADARAEVSEHVCALEGTCRDLSIEIARLREASAVTAVNFGEAQLEIARLQTKLARVEALPAKWNRMLDDIEAALRDDPQPSAPLETREASKASDEKPGKASQHVCDTCNDTHRMRFGEDRDEVMCTRCPTPCERCGGKPIGPYCVKTPCDCECHANSWQYVRFRKASDAADGGKSLADVVAIHDGKHGKVCDLCEVASEVRRLREENDRLAGLPSIMKLKKRIFEADAKIARVEALVAEAEESDDARVDVDLIRGALSDDGVPYRNLLITGVCNLDHEHGKGDCVYETQPSAAPVPKGEPYNGY